MLYEYIYWKRGATEVATQQKSLTLKQFETHYSDALIRLADQFADRNLRQCLHQLQQQGTVTDDLIQQLREFDYRVNVRWKLAHLRSAVRHLPKNLDAKATGGTNWPRYLPPTGQQRRFFPELWTDAERQNWGKLIDNL